LISPEQVQTAAAFYQRAAQVIEEGGGDDYARQLLGNCLKLDPFNIAYRKALRDLNRKGSGSVLGRWFGSINVLPLKSKLRAAKAASDWRKVLELGEDILARVPTDVDTHIDLTDAAEGLGLPDLALWFLEQARALMPDNVELLRALARYHENRREWKQAVLAWERVGELVADDVEAKKKINAITVKDHISKANYRR
jgi:hypothetical protein